ncbi:MAG: NADH-quinone oxidoreductase subunit J family protein, partial [Planctomycetota bacterium]
MDFLVEHAADLLFYLFALGAVVAALGVITLRNPMYCAISLLAALLCVAALFLLRHAEFLALVQVFVYGGGIMVLFLFVIMLVNLHRLREVRVFGENAPMAVVLAVLLVALVLFVFLGVDHQAVAPPDAFVSVEGEPAGNAEAVAWTLYRDYLLPFE